MQLTVAVTQRKNKAWGGFIAGNADNHTIRRVCAFDLDPVAPTGPVATVCSLGDDTFEAGNFAQPLTRQIRVRRLQNQLQAWMQVMEKALQAMSPLAKDLSRNNGFISEQAKAGQQGIVPVPMEGVRAEVDCGKFII